MSGYFGEEGAEEGGTCSAIDLHCPLLLGNITVFDIRRALKVFVSFLGICFKQHCSFNAPFVKKKNSYGPSKKKKAK